MYIFKINSQTIDEDFFRRFQHRVRENLTAPETNFESRPKRVRNRFCVYF